MKEITIVIYFHDLYSNTLPEITLEMSEEDTELKSKRVFLMMNNFVEPLAVIDNKQV
jgi:hypothetical protein